MFSLMLEPSIQSAGARLREALQATYLEFAAPPPHAIDGCPCCIGKRGVDVLLTTPLRELTGKQLWAYVSGAYLTIGGDRDFQYLLPRILELSVCDPGNSNDPEIVLGKLGLANWRSWPRDQQRAVEEFVTAWFEFVLARDVADARLGWFVNQTEQVLCGAARASFPLETWLLRLRLPFAEPVLTDLKQRYPRHLSAFWEDAPAGFHELGIMLNVAQP